MVFPGQGSQSVGMQAELAERYPVVGETYAEASELLGYDLWSLIEEGPPHKLDATEVTQPAMLAAGVAAWRVWQQEGGPMPGLMAGHSLGEYTALVCAGSLEFGDGIKIVRRRGELMREASPEGDSAMAAVLGLDDDSILDICDTASSIGVAEAVNFNSPGQVVVAGHKGAVQNVIELAKDAGARRAILLHVSVPSHSSLMKPAGDKLAQVLDATEFRTPETTVYTSVEARPYADADDIRALLTRQVSSSVQWVNTVQALLEAGADTLIECGPGKVLTGLARRIDRSVPATCIDTPDAVGKALSSVSPD
jgi:[acyl-carrier-protein] S-malonyltransferase